MTKDEILKSIEAQQQIQMANPPSSKAWQDASKRILELGTELNSGVTPKDAWGKQ